MKYSIASIASFTLLVLAISLLPQIPTVQRAYSQDIKDVLFIHKLSEKGTATFGDAVKFYVLTIGKKPAEFSKNLEILKASGISEGIDYIGTTKMGDAPLRKGVLAYMIAQHLDLGDSLLYLILKTQRYAFRACIANKIMDYNASEWDSVSGGELIEIMSIVSDRISGGK